MSTGRIRPEVLAKFAHDMGKLKRVPRTGWIDRGIPPESVESVADHSFRVAALAWLLSAEIEGIDRFKVVTMSLLHDMAEASVGDQPPYDREALEHLNQEERADKLNQRHHPAESAVAAKHQAEQQALEKMIQSFPESSRTEIETLWQELRLQQTPEAKLVKEIDRLEGYLQSRELAARFPDAPMDSFSLEVDEMVTIPELVELREAIAELQLNEETRL